MRVQMEFDLFEMISFVIFFVRISSDILTTNRSSSEINYEQVIISSGLSYSS